MSQFEGGKSQVRCVDCTKLSGTHCTAKSIKVSPKKRRLCPVYEFKGEYANRTSAEAMYMPTVDKKTIKMLRRLLAMGALPVTEDGSVDMSGGFARTKTLPMPASTATAGLIGTKDSADPLIYQTSSSKITDSRIVWDTNGEDNGEPKGNRS